MKLRLSSPKSTSARTFMNEQGQRTSDGGVSGAMQSVPATGRGISWMVWLALLVVLIGSLLHVYQGYTSADLSGHAWGSDDAYITFRYACNLADGHGLVFQTGEPPVEGYSNFLFALLLAPSCGQTPDFRPYVTAVLLSALAALGALLIFRGIILRDGGGPPADAMVLLAALAPQLWLRVASGLETVPVFLVQIAAWASVVALRGRPRSVGHGAVLGASLAAMVLLRADGFVMAGIVLAYLALTRAWRGFCVAGGVSGLVTLGHFLWRHATYGEWLPNTAHVKVAGALPARAFKALIQLARIALDEGLLIHLAVLGLAALVTLYRREWRQLSFPVFFGLALVAYWVYVGGDNMRGRFLLVIFPLGLWQVHRWYARGALRGRAVAVVLVLLALSQLHPLLTDARFDYTRDKYDRWITLGRYLATHHPGATVAVDAAGKIPYFSGLRAIDMLGLNDRHIARRPASRGGVGHGKFDPDYVLSRRPDLIATWIESRGGALDLAFGLDESRYVAAGYAPRYLVNTERIGRPGADVIDVGDWRRDEIHARIEEGYTYAVLQRIQ